MMQPMVERAWLEDKVSYRGKWKLEGHSRSSRCGSETKMRSASYASAVYRPRRDTDPYGASRFYGKKAREN
ncbi:jg14750 [Pararge aegeria aegeria]|uniref:Jg14750 protein n=1 Tax=Pararge aegeria aegeria TaxID=348720 RepID=A0A8S4SMR1_9NEOP|nr:jg14750 [Pararge aegeria aegeria]